MTDKIRGHRLTAFQRGLLEDSLTPISNEELNKALGACYSVNGNVIVSDNSSIYMSSAYSNIGRNFMLEANDNENELKMIAGDKAVEFYKNTGISFELLKEGLLSGFTIGDFNKLYNYYLESKCKKRKEVSFNKYIEILFYWENALR